MILALLIGCWCLDYILLRHTSYIGLAFLSLSQLTFLAASISHLSLSFLSLSLIASCCFSPFLFFRKHPKRQGRLVSLTYGDCSRRFALVSGPATGLIVGPALSLFLLFPFYFIFLYLFFFFFPIHLAKCLQHSGNEQKVARRKGSTRHGRLSIN